MSRYATHGQEIIYDDSGNVIGINMGFGFYSEHEWGYRGNEIANPAKHSRISGPGSFEDARISDPSQIMFLERDDGVAGITNAVWLYNQGVLEDSRRFQERLIDGNRDVSEAAVFGAVPEYFDAFWNDTRFIVFARSEMADEAIRDVYEHIMVGDAAIGSDFTPLFSNRGLSIVILSRLEDGAHDARAFETYLDELMEQGEQEVNDHLEEMGNHPWNFSEHDGALWLGNVQASDVLDVNGTPTVYYYCEPHDMLEFFEVPEDENGWRNSNIDSIVMFDIPHRLTAEGIYALYREGNSPEYVAKV